MNKLLMIPFLILISLSSLVSSSNEFEINDIVVKCSGNCQKTRSDFKDLKTKFTNKTDFLNTLKFKISNLEFSTLSFEINQNDKKNVLVIQYNPKLIINEIKYSKELLERFVFVKKFIKIKKGDFLSHWKIEKTKEVIESSIKNAGYISGVVNYQLEKTDNKVNIVFSIKNYKSINVYDIGYNSSQENTVTDLKRILEREKGRIWNRSRIEEKLDNYLKRLFEQGFYFASYKYKYKYIQEKGLALDIDLQTGPLFSFNFLGNRYFSHQELTDTLKKEIGSTLVTVTVQDIRRILEKLYSTKGFYGIDVTVREEENLVNNQKLFFVSIEENSKKNLLGVVFKGNFKFTDSQIMNLFTTSAPALIKREYFDDQYLIRFSEILKKEYLRKGFVFASVERPYFRNDSPFSSEVEYRINEGKQCTLSSINIEGLESEAESMILSKLFNKTGAPLNLADLDQDIITIQKELREQGYYFATIAKEDIKSFLQYQDVFESSVINITVNRLAKTKYRRTIITGYDYTKRKIIEREIRLDENELLTPQKVTNIISRLNSLSLFSSVTVTPQVVSRNDNIELIDLYVKVVEKDFGAVEVALGYRTDIGLKLSSAITYNNLGGKNRSVGFLAQGNYRFNFDNLDNRRRLEQNRFVEYLTKVSFTEPYLFSRLFGNNLIFESELSFQKKRFFGFDAEVLRLSPKIAKAINEYFSTSLRWQLDYINQFDGTKLEDNEIFQIGTLSPSFTVDFRDQAINPRKGVLLNLQFDFANPSFGSMSDDDIEIDYMRVISRNQLYVPLSQNIVWATSISAGFEENFQNDLKRDNDGNIIINSNGVNATKGFIPSINVFRLDGVDNVRGFADSEINKLESGLDISDTVIQGKAYFANLKVEARYSINDNFVAGLFYDAGRVFVNKFKPLDLRSSVGATFKVLTPVGSLDFDYGIKTHRKELGGGIKETFGRFHLAIGYF